MDALAAYGSDSEDSGSELMSAPAAALHPHQQHLHLPQLPFLLQHQHRHSQRQANTTVYPHWNPNRIRTRKKAKLAEAAKTAGSGVGALFAMLPAPKSAPTATTKKPGAPKKISTDCKGEKEDQDEDKEDEDDDDAPVSFFPLGAAATAAPVTAQSSNGKAASNTYIPLFFDKKPLTTEEKQAQSHEEIDVSMTNEQYSYSGNEHYAYSDQYGYPTNDQYPYQPNDQYAYPTNDAYAYRADGYAQGPNTGDYAANTIALDNAGLQKLGMRKGRDAPINVIDVSARNQMSQAQHVRTAMKMYSKWGTWANLIFDNCLALEPSATLKRKHNIMSLAYEAKANEAQLNANWAASRKTKAETQAKYRF
ncbi:MAG: hypothetical protein J3Q66DRAFT_404985 [Benniella sp.]|nr:MAG: hypothetical protein J3Q66DRAFT_404985 [Benniella sp.]